MGRGTRTSYKMESSQILISIISLFFSMVLISISAAVTVHVDYPDKNGSIDSFPDVLNVTLVNESGSSTFLNLKRAKHNVPNIPVYTLKVDNDGKFYSHRENMPEIEDVCYYQDVVTEAIVQATITRESGETKSRLVLKGELIIEGQKYKLEHETRGRRDAVAAPSSDGEYKLIPVTTAPISVNDYLVPPPEITQTIQESEANAPKILRETPTAYTLSTTPRASKTPERSRARRQTSGGGTITIDVAALADYSVYKRYYSSYGSKAQTFQMMREGFAFIFNGVDMRYQGIRNSQYKYRIRLTKLVIADTAAASSFTENFKESNAGGDLLDAQKALTAFAEFAAGSGRDVLFPSDHSVVFTSYNLISRGSSGETSDGTTGLAYTSTMCRPDGKSTSVVEDRGGLQCVDTVAHELGHSLSAPHDGDGNNCRSSDRYIMSAGGNQATDSNKLNSYNFSSCSVNYFDTFVRNSLRTARGQTCLLEQLSTSSDIPDVSSRLPGQEFSPDNLCRLIYGNSSRMCRGVEFGSPDDICTSLFCLDPSTSSTCYGHKAAHGTTCGNGKMCLNGQCTSDPRAPKVDDDCPFGDQPGEAFDGQTCEQFVNGFTGYCYQEVVKTRCCGSCKKVYRRISGCLYGDTAQGCTPDICPRISGRTLQQCCGTCNYGTPLPGTVSPLTSNLVSVSQQIDFRTSVRETTTTQPPTTTAKSATTRAPTSEQCVDSPNVLINRTTCARAVRSSPYLCIDRRVRNICCGSCKLVYRGIRG